MSVSLEQMKSTTEMWCGRWREGLVDRRHTAFTQAQMLRGATDRTSQQVATDFLKFFETAGSTLFRDEEEWVFRSLQPTPQAVIRAHEEHVEISSLVSTLIHEVEAGCVDLRVAHGLGELLTAHLLGEEEDVRPLLDQSPPVVAP